MLSYGSCILCSALGPPLGETREEEGLSSPVWAKKKKEAADDEEGESARNLCKCIYNVFHKSRLLGIRTVANLLLACGILCFTGLQLLLRNVSMSS